MRRVRPRSTTSAVAAAAATALVAAALTAAPLGGAAAAAPPAGHAPAVKPVPAVAGHRLIHGVSSPLTIAQCQATWGVNCYSPLQYRQAYDLNPLYRAGVTGKGRTIVIVDSFGSPTIQHDLDVYSAQWGIKSSTVQVVKWGDVPPFDPANPDHTGWAGESTLDVEMAHAVAPDAHIVLVETGVAETEGVTGLPEMMDAEKYLIDHGVGDVITQSFGATENTFPGFGKGDFSSIQKLRYAFQDAVRHGVTVLASSGDGGATDAMADGETDYPYPVNSWPSADPLVTSIGGTQLHLDDAGDRTAPDSVYNDYGAGGGGQSHVFPRPSYQAGVRNVVGARRGTPDISMAAAVDGGAWVYSSYDPTATGWDVYGGTSEASPLFSGIVALADQLGGHRVGDIHQALYALAKGSAKFSGIVDVKDGTNNTYDGVTGYTAVKGYDMATGVGTLDAARFVPALALTAWGR
ncbi:S53 family peptidase [Actinacidiphila bryophytorum]|uniref:Subtilase family protein n=1 Tax=Actinacidiphila bryophytorum TaxID=1436133 RepID=A0A9W4H6H2_9ACTN|nr:S53 family peptidase [Actinacidiphila bryophytorum]MBM9437652.1 S53 family peptidase [Actinacidiphila bryophytorum]MBN6543608.1 S53 family peptidase [Actinacidiphila bryophytorum]CAG7655593.1 Subtilase family protein [Actinacidiphila bryophytorum]